MGKITADGNESAFADSDDDSFLSDDLASISQKELPPQIDEASMPASASELLLADLSEKTRLLRIARQKARQYKLKCEALASQVSSAKKRQRDQLSTPLSASADDEEVANPAKKHSPENKAILSAPDLVDTSDSESDDDVSPPIEAPEEKPVQKMFQKLNSLLCAYKDKQVKPGSHNLPFDLCAEMCKEEAEAVQKWDANAQRYFHPAIISALRLVYPNKVDSWFGSNFLKSPKGAAKYWVQVLLRRSEIWAAAASKAAMAKKHIKTKSLKEKIRAKIEQRRQSRLNMLSVPTACPSRQDPFKTPQRRVSLGLSSDSDDSTKAVIDLSVSPPAKASSSCGKSAPENQIKMAPHPK